MIKLKRGMDQHSLEIVRPGEDPEHVGYVQWHPEREPRIVLSESFSSLTISEVRCALDGYNAHCDRTSVKMLAEMLAALRWDSESHCLERFEEWASLYHRRFHRLAPGKSEPTEVCRDSNDAENRAQMDVWHQSGLAKMDAIMEVVRLRRRVKELEAEIETITGGEGNKP